MEVTEQLELYKKAHPLIPPALARDARLALYRLFKKYKVNPKDQDYIFKFSAVIGVYQQQKGGGLQ